jgi:cytochrome c553
LRLGCIGVRAVAVTLFAGMVAAACGETSRATDDALSRTGRVVAMSGGDGGARNACFACHGLDGLGDGDAAPRLAGLQAGYLHKQLEDYAADLRPDTTMGQISRRLSPESRFAVAAYYAALPPGAIGAPARAAPAAYAVCVNCHGAAGEGAGAAGPAIASQPAPYLTEQLLRWRRIERRNDPRGVMRVAAAKLSDSEITAIAVWLSTQSASQPPDSAVATGSESVLAWEAPAASRAGRRHDR